MVQIVVFLRDRHAWKTCYIERSVRWWKDVSWTDTSEHRNKNRGKSKAKAPSMVSPMSSHTLRPCKQNQIGHTTGMSQCRAGRCVCRASQAGPAHWHGDSLSQHPDTFSRHATPRRHGHSPRWTCTASPAAAAIGRCCCCGPAYATPWRSTGPS